MCQGTYRDVWEQHLGAFSRISCAARVGTEKGDGFMLCLSLSLDLDVRVSIELTTMSTNVNVIVAA